MWRFLYEVAFSVVTEGVSGDYLMTLFHFKCRLCSVSCEGHVTDVYSNELCHIVLAQKQHAVKAHGGRGSKLQSI
jgi:hypothetical protein